MQVNVDTFISLLCEFTPYTLCPRTRPCPFHIHPSISHALRDAHYVSRRQDTRTAPVTKPTEPTELSSAQFNSRQPNPSQCSAKPSSDSTRQPVHCFPIQLHLLDGQANQPAWYCRSPCDRPIGPPSVRPWKIVIFCLFPQKIAQFYTTHAFVYVSEWDIRCPNVLRPLHRRIYPGIAVLTVCTGEGVSCTPTASTSHQPPHNIFERLYVAYYRCHFDTAGNVEWSFCAFSFAFTSYACLNGYISLTTYSFVCGNHSSRRCPSSW